MRRFARPIGSRASRVEMEPKPDKKETVLETMLDLVVERGFHNAPMSLLSKRSGVSAGVIYHYFPSKDDLIHALYLRVKEVKRRTLMEGFTPGVPPKESFLRAWTNAYRFYRDHGRETRFLDQYENSPFCVPTPGQDDPGLDPAVAEFQDAFRSLKAGGVLKNLPQAAIHALTFGVAAGLAKGGEPIEPAALDRVAEACWQAIATD